MLPPWLVNEYEDLKANTHLIYNLQIEVLVTHLKEMFHRLSFNMV